jgi:hypothetical protein
MHLQRFVSLTMVSWTALWVETFSKRRTWRDAVEGSVATADPEAGALYITITVNAEIYVNVVLDLGILDDLWYQKQALYTLT